MIQKTKDIVIRGLLTVIWLSQLSFYTYHTLDAHTENGNVPKIAANADGFKEAGSSCDFCTHFITKVADVGFFALVIFIIAPVFVVPFLKENNLPFQIARKSFLRGPPQ